MQACLVHHADAISPAIDPQRPLSPLGREQAARVAAEVRAAGFQAAEIWHSGKLRARQTAEAFLAGSPFARITMVRGLRPDDPVAWVRDVLMVEEAAVLVVGHWPHLPRLLQALAPGADEFPLHGAVALERQADGRWVECWRVVP